MPAWGPQPHQIGSLTLDRGGAAGAKLLSRRWFLANASLVVPDGCNWLSVRASGPGGSSAINGYAGGGSAFAREDRSCAPGKPLSVTVPLGSTSASRLQPASVTLDGVVICQAASGNPATTSNDGLGGLASECIGTTCYSGGRGGLSVASTAGENGGPAGSNDTVNGLAGGGGGAAGERNAPDALILGGKGADGSSGGPYEGRGQFPGGGASQDRSDNSRTVAAGGDGVVVIEFWSAKP